jgi:hypothetical protein
MPQTTHYKLTPLYAGPVLGREPVRSAVIGIPGPAGPTGAPGQGLAAGGAASDFLVKNSGTDYDTEWLDLFDTANTWVNQQSFSVGLIVGGESTFDTIVANGVSAGGVETNQIVDLSASVTLSLGSGSVGVSGDLLLGKTSRQLIGLAASNVGLTIGHGNTVAAAPAATSMCIGRGNTDAGAQSNYLYGELCTTASACSQCFGTGAGVTFGASCSKCFGFGINLAFSASVFAGLGFGTDLWVVHGQSLVAGIGPGFASSTTGGRTTAAGQFVWTTNSNDPRFTLQRSDDTQPEDVTDIRGSWATSTHGSRAGKAEWGVYSVTTFQVGVTIEANSGGVRVGFNGATPVAKPTITGSRGGNAALANLLAALASRGDLTDSTTI